MRLIDADTLELDAEWNEYEDGFIAYSKMQIDNTPTVKAIPIERLEQILSEIQSLRGCSCSCSDGIIDDVEDIIDKALKEVEQ